jgi:sec-independent protein translocase protein TatC
VSNEEDEIEASRAPLLEHLNELRTRLIICIGALVVGFFACFFFAEQIYMILLHPFKVAAALLAQQKTGQQHGPFDLIFAMVGVTPLPQTGEALKLVFTAPLEFFFTKMKLAGFGAVIITFPILAWQLYRFVAPGLYKKERYAFLPFLIASPLLFIMGGALVYYLMLPFVLWFSLSQQIIGPDIQVELLPKVSDYLELVTKLLLAFGLCFQLPVVLSLAGLAGLVTGQQLAAFRRYAIVLIVFVAAIVTPPDPLSQIMLAVPIYLLYEVSIWCVKLMQLRRAKAEAAEQALVSQG